MKINMKLCCYLSLSSADESTASWSARRRRIYCAETLKCRAKSQFRGGQQKKKKRKKFSFQTEARRQRNCSSQIKLAYNGFFIIIVGEKSFSSFLWCFFGCSAREHKKRASCISIKNDVKHSFKWVILCNESAKMGNDERKKFK